MGVFNLRCLVVDDSLVMRKIARRILEGQGVHVEAAADGAITLESCRRSLPACVLLDCNMPVMNWIDFLRARRREFGPDHPAVLFCTTENDLEFIEQAIEHGAQEFIMKPFDAEILLGKFAQVGLL
ncbi:MAG TPA: response regulator [Acetobacteraceae bacterium]|jgi:two-component system chemotaxis response regulator CheY